MHEWGLARRLLKLIEDEAHSRSLTRVHRVRVETGALGHAEREALRFNFTTAAQGTVAQGAELDIADLPIKALCPVCLVESLVTDHDQACPQCNAWPLTALEGGALRITELVAT